jgi:transcriptional regulator with XRE-family HTH domain
MARAFGERLHRYREDRGLSQRQLALQAGVAPAQMSRYERGLGLPGADTLVSIAKVLQVSLDTLLMGKADRSEDLIMKNVILLERFRQVEKLERKDQEMIIELVDSVLARRQMESALAATRRRSA